VPAGVPFPVVVDRPRRTGRRAVRYGEDGGAGVVAGQVRRARWTVRAGSGVALVCAVLLGVPTAATADTDDGLSETSRTRYEVDGSGPVRVTVTTTIRNEQPASG